MPLPLELGAASALTLRAAVVEPDCTFSSPARKPFSHERCAGVNGALSGNTGIEMAMVFGWSDTFAQLMKSRGLLPVETCDQVRGVLPADELIERFGWRAACGEIPTQH